MDEEKTFEQKANNFASGLAVGVLCTLGFGAGVLSEEKSQITQDNLEQKTQNEIVIDSAKVDTTNYSNKDTINYFNYKK